MKTKHAFLVVILVFLCTSVQAQNYKTFDKNVLSLYNAVFANNKNSNVITTPFVVGGSKFLSNQDVQVLTKDYGFVQSDFEIESKDTFTLKDNGFFNVIEYDTIKKYSGTGFTNERPLSYYLMKSYNVNYVRHYSKPIFSSNGLFAVVRCDDVSGLLSGFGSVYLMQKKENQWSILKVLFSGMS